MSNMNYEVPAALALALANASPRTVGRVGIIGANPMGVGIAMHLLDADVPVTLFELARESLDAGMALARSGYRDAVTKGVLAPDQRDRRMALLAGSVNFHHLKDCDLIIETVCTDTAGKEKLFRRLDQVAKPGAILMTHAAHGAVDHIAGCTRRGGDVLGWHAPGPANPDRMWELVQGTQTSGEALATVIALARKLQQVAAVSDLSHGAVTKARSVSQPPETGVGAWQIDQALD
jgi:3-hydroxyacyl-CoA dehydrogenase